VPSLSPLFAVEEGGKKFQGGWPNCKLSQKEDSHLLRKTTKNKKGGGKRVSGWNWSGSEGCCGKGAKFGHPMEKKRCQGKKGDFRGRLIVKTVPGGPCGIDAGEKKEQGEERRGKKRTTE